MLPEVWVSAAGTTYRAAADDFINAQIPFYYSGSWQVANLSTKIGDGLRLGRHRLALRHRRLFGSCGRRGSRRDQVHRQPRGSGHRDGLPRLGRGGARVQRTNAVPAGPRRYP